MDITPQDETTKTISDDQELAQALAGVMPDDPNAIIPAGDMQFEETSSTQPSASLTPPSQLPPMPPVMQTPATNSDDITIPDVPTLSTDSEPDTTPTESSEPLVISSDDSSDEASLEAIKTKALNEIRPLINSVNLPADEKFDTYLLLIRSTDDTSLIEPAHNAALEITDEKRKAEALLNIIKEIDYLSRKDK